MPKYLFLYSGGQTPQNEAEREAQSQAWKDWLGSNSFSDTGAPFNQTHALVGGGESCSQFNGYSVLEVSSIEDAEAIAKDAPLLASGGTVEIRECEPFLV